MRKPKTTRAAAEPLNIKIRGEGVIVDATIDDMSSFTDGLKAGVEGFVRTMQAAVQAAAHPSDRISEHDFDTVQRLIKHADVQTLESVQTLIKVELESRRKVS